MKEHATPGYETANQAIVQLTFLNQSLYLKKDTLNLNWLYLKNYEVYLNNSGTKIKVTRVYKYIYYQVSVRERSNTAKK